MIRLTQSLQHFLFINYPDILPLVMFGHAESITDDMYAEYLDWCETSEGKKYLKGGSEYKEKEEKEDGRNSSCSMGS